MLLRGVDREEVQRGMTLVKPGSVTSHSACEAEIFTLTAKEGGRHTPFATGYKPQLYFGAADVSATLDAGDTLVNPGDRATIKLTLHEPVAMENGSRFAIREGGKTIGAGVITAVS